MLNFRGTSRADVISAITDAVDFLRAHSTGPAMEEWLDRLGKPDREGVPPLTRLHGATDNAMFSYAVKQCAYTFLRGCRVMQYHAIHNTGGKGLEIYNRLSAFGAFSGGMTLEKNEFDTETEEWLERRGIGARDMLTVPGVRHCMSQYGLVIPELTTGKWDWHAPEINPLRLKVEEVLDPFYDTGDINRTGIGLITNSRDIGKTPQGIVVGCTLRAAQALAKAFPSFQVIDYEGNRIHPPKPEIKGLPRFKL